MTVDFNTNIGVQETRAANEEGVVEVKIYKRESNLPRTLQSNRYTVFHVAPHTPADEDVTQALKLSFRIPSFADHCLYES
jgi:hypothetical protein